jgi:uncharacterized RDD family membrane protein YckC
MKENLQKVGDGTRVLNFLVDGLLVFLLAMGGFQFWKFYVVYWHAKPINFWWFFAGAMFVFYFLFELLFQKTPGKWLTVSKVVAINGARPSLVAIFIRSLSRLVIIDFLFNAFLGVPLHDYLSRTRVVES